MKLIVGLGNPGRQYEMTPHNVGFETVDVLAKRHGGQWSLERRFEAETCDVQIDGKRVTLMKPLTFMNLSGKAVAAYAQKNGVAPDELLVISDDLHLPLGRIRLRAGGSHGGQKGLLSIIQSLGTMDFPRLRIGVVREGLQIRDNAAYVLGKVRPDDRPKFDLAKEDAADAVETVIRDGLVTAMNRFNGKG